MKIDRTIYKRVSQRMTALDLDGFPIVRVNHARAIYIKTKTEIFLTPAFRMPILSYNKRDNREFYT